MKLYRAGDPSLGAAYWSASEQEARRLNPDFAVHEAEILPDARIYRSKEGEGRSRHFMRKLAKTADVLVFRAKDGTYGYVVLNPHILRILR